MQLFFQTMGYDTDLSTLSGGTMRPAETVLTINITAPMQENKSPESFFR